MNKTLVAYDFVTPEGARSCCERWMPANGQAAALSQLDRDEIGRLSGRAGVGVAAEARDLGAPRESRVDPGELNVFRTFSRMRRRGP